MVSLGATQTRAPCLWTDAARLWREELSRGDLGASVGTAVLSTRLVSFLLFPRVAHLPEVLLGGSAGVFAGR